MIEQRLIVDVTDIRLRLHCACGTDVSVVPAEILKDTISHCPNCHAIWPEHKGADHVGGPVTTFVRAFQALAKAAKDDKTGFRVQFEIEIESAGAARR